MKQFAVVLMVLTGVVRADTWEFDRVHSEVTFSVTHMMVSKVSGIFRDFSITLDAPGESLVGATIEAVIRVESISTNNDRRDTHLRSDDFFHVEQYPEITFKSTSINRIAENRYAITGDLTIRGITRQVTFDAVSGGSVKTSRGILIGWNATATINRYDFGLRWNRVLEAGGIAVSEEVDIELNLRFRRATSPS